jgi:hypothetical protein
MFTVASMLVPTVVPVIVAVIVVSSPVIDDAP